MSWFTLRDGEKIYYEDTKNGQETLVMLHGLCSSHNVYSRPVRALRKRARCITVDQRGHRKSKNAQKGKVDITTLSHDLHDLLVGLSLDHVTVLGWSMGAGVIMDYLRNYGSDRLKQVILCDMSPKQMNDSNWNLGLYQGKFINDYISAANGASFFNNFKDFALNVMPVLAGQPSFFRDPILKIFLKEFDQEVLLGLTASLKAKDYRDVIRNLDIPLTYLYADPGSIYSPKLARWYARNCPTKVRTAGFKGTTHMFIYERPHQFAKRVAAVL